MNFKEYDNYSLDTFPGITHSQYGRLYIYTYKETGNVWTNYSSLIPWHHWSLSLPVNNNITNFFDNGYYPVRLNNVGDVTYSDDCRLSNLNCALFNGLSDSYLKSSENENLEVTSYCVSMWLKCSQDMDNNNVYPVFHRLNGDGESVGNILDYKNNQFSIYYYNKTFNINFNNNDISLRDILTEQWSHVLYGVSVKKKLEIAYYDITFYLYINGICYYNRLQENEDVYMSQFSNNDYWFVGTDWKTTDFYLGKMEDLRFYNHSLTTQEITHLYNQGRGTSNQCLFNGFPTFKPPKYWFKGNNYISPYVLHQTGIKTNEIINSQNIEHDQTSSIVDIYPAVYRTTYPFDQYPDTTSIEIKNNGILLYSSASNINDSSCGLWSVSMWLYHIDTDNEEHVLITNIDSITTSGSGEYCIYVDDNDNCIYLNYYDTILSSNVNINLLESALDERLWYHIVFVSDDTLNFRYNFYLNGVLVDFSQLNIQLNIDNNIYIGDILSGSYKFNTNLQDIRLYNYALSYQEVKNIHNNGYGLYY